MTGGLSSTLRSTPPACTAERTAGADVVVQLAPPLIPDHEEFDHIEVILRDVLSRAVEGV